MLILIARAMKALRKTELFAVKRQISELRLHLILMPVEIASMKGCKKSKEEKPLTG
jgi:hypothetical protein